MFFMHLYSNTQHNFLHIFLYLDIRFVIQQDNNPSQDHRTSEQAPGTTIALLDY